VMVLLVSVVLVVCAHAAVWRHWRWERHVVPQSALIRKKIIKQKIFLKTVNHFQFLTTDQNLYDFRTWIYRSNEDKKKIYIISNFNKFWIFQPTKHWIHPI
jgi:hypothetical protein